MTRFPTVGFSTNVLDNPPDVVRSCEALSLHFRAIELELGEAAEKAVYEASTREYEGIVCGIRGLCESRGIHLSVHAPYLGHNLSSQKRDERQASQERLLWAIRVAVDLGSHKVTFHPGYNQGRETELTIGPLLESLDRVNNEASAHGVSLCLENMGADRREYIVYSAKQQERICKESGVFVALDVIHLASVAPEPNRFDDELARLLPWVRNVHIADMNIPLHVHIPIGEGDLPLTKILAQLGRGGYTGPAIVEEFGGPYQTQRFIDNAVAYKQHLEALSEAS